MGETRSGVVLEWDGFEWGDFEWGGFEWGGIRSGVLFERGDFEWWWIRVGSFRARNTCYKVVSSGEASSGVASSK